jgi:hypothetical protein
MNRMGMALTGLFFCPFLQGDWQPFAGPLRYDEVCHLTSHNSYAAVEHGYCYAQQQISIEKQLAYGVRGLMLDIGWEKDRIVLIHKNSLVTRLICKGKAPMPFESALETIKKFLEEHPLEVVTIFLENYVKDSSLLDKALSSAGVSPYILTPHHWNSAHGWPTFTWMRTHNKRLIIFNATADTDYCFHEWKHVVENQWGTVHPVKACKERLESKRWKKEPRSLYLLNYFPFVDFRGKKSYEQINTDRLAAFLERALAKGLDTQCQPCHLPTFLCLDYVDVGDGMKHTQHINAQRTALRSTPYA